MDEQQVGWINGWLKNKLIHKTSGWKAVRLANNEWYGWLAMGQTDGCMDVVGQIEVQMTTWIHEQSDGRWTDDGMNGQMAEKLVGLID